ncbi:TIGR00341 family protein [Tropicimonas sp. IMCC34011]|uniref:TIGR00341 family protein n=1 Tax=Tropicimonas sp. IMCC34011 TaxID=2248759 RepID=UPI000E260214|nr:TIGR00341 family protein [Tropicimonas sp. IMCC34011]
MAYRMLLLNVAPDRSDGVEDVIKEIEPRTWWRSEAQNGEDIVQYYVVLHESRSQVLQDKLSEEFEEDQFRLVTLALESVLPQIDNEEEQERLEQTETSSARAEIYDDVLNNALLTWDFLILTAAAAFVAAIGLTSGQVAVVIGAMVIAPLLGPILAFAFGAALGNRRLLLISLRALGAGLGVAVAVSAAMGTFLPLQIDDSMVNFSEPLGLSTAALPLASGVAAALMVVQGQASALVGVMVAAALLPPIAAMGLLVGSGAWYQAGRAAVTVIANIVAINLAAQAVFMWRGIRPHRWLSDDSKAGQSRIWMLGAWVILLGALLGGILFVEGSFAQGGDDEGQETAAPADPG